MAKKIVVGMSGGVDSSVAALLLKQAGWDVAGVMLKLWAEEGCGRDNQCCSMESVSQARLIAAKIGIPFYLVDCVQFFYDRIVTDFMDEYINGMTPNPCTECNRLVRWDRLLHFARGIGAEYIATGHYARLENDPDGTVHLLRGVDDKKDQSYVLSRLSQDYLKHTVFPLGERCKPDVRAIAADFDLQSAQKPDSQDICFIADGDYRKFLQRHCKDKIKPGRIIDTEGIECGTHDGLPFYTIGQRKGINVFRADPVYILEKDVAANQLVIGKKEKLGKDIVRISGINWINKPDVESFEALAQFRYKSQTHPVSVKILDEDNAVIRVNEALYDIAPGQIAAIYKNEREVLGSGKIMRTEKAI